MCWFTYLEQQEKERKRERERQEIQAFCLFHGLTKDELIFQVLLFFLSGGCQLATFAKIYFHLPWQPKWSQLGARYYTAYSLKIISINN